MTGGDPQHTIPGSVPPSEHSPGSPTVDHVAQSHATPHTDVTMLEPASAASSRAKPTPSGPMTVIDSSASVKPVEKKPAKPKPNVTISGYDVLAELGRGGMGVVYKARNINLQDKIVAIKMMSRSGSASVDELVRFRAEAEMVASLQHENIIDIYDIKTDNGLTYLILEYIDGGNLADKLKAQKPTPREAAQMIETLARAMDFAHQKKIIHRDLKPANVLVTKSGVLKITDFGLGKLLEHGDEPSRTHAGAIMGTPPYMAPEQAAGRTKEIGPATDVYALGAILYEMLTGRLLFMGENLTSLLQQMQHEEPIPPSWLVPLKTREKQLSTICLKCLEKNPAKRYATALELAEELHRWLDEQPIKTKPIGRIAKAWRFIKRYPAPIAVGTLSVLIIAGLILAWFADSLAKEARIGKEQAENAKKAQRHTEEIREQHRTSLSTLGKVLDEVYEESGSLSRQAGLGSLQQNLKNYYDLLYQNSGQLRNEDREQLAYDLTRLGVLISRAGNKNEALRVLGNAKSLYTQSDNAQTPKIQQRLARTDRDIGELQTSMSNWADAEAAYQEAENILQSLDPNSADGDVQRALAEVYHMRGVLYNTRRGNRADVQLAKEYYLKGLEVRRALWYKSNEKDRTPDDRRNFARSHGYLGDVLLDLGEVSNADVSYWISHGIREQLVKEFEEEVAKHSSKSTERDSKAEENRRRLEEYRFQLARSWGNLGNLQRHFDSYLTAVHFYEQSRIIRLDLVKQNPSVVDYLSDLCSCDNNIADLLLLGLEVRTSKTRKERAIAAARESIEWNRKLLIIDPQHTDSTRSLTEALVLLAQTLIDDSPDQVVAPLEEARKILSDLESKKLMTANDYYNQAAALAMQTEIVFRKGDLAAEEMAFRKTRIMENLDRAAKSMVRGGKTSQQLIDRVRAFKCLREAEEAVPPKDKS